MGELFLKIPGQAPIPQSDTDTTAYCEMDPVGIKDDPDPSQRIVCHCTEHKGSSDAEKRFQPAARRVFFAYRDVGTVALAHPCASRHSDILSIVVERREKVRPFIYGRSPGRETGPGHARERRAERDVGTVALAHPCAARHSDILSIVVARREKVRPFIYGRSPGRETGLGHARERRAGRDALRSGACREFYRACKALLQANR